MRRVCLAIRSKARATAVGGAVHTKKTVWMPSTQASTISGRERSPRITSTCDGKPAASRLRHCADVCACDRQLRDNLTADGASCSDDEHTIHAGHSICGGGMEIKSSRGDEGQCQADSDNRVISSERH